MRSLLIVCVLCGIASADPDPKQFGVGYKAGNGVGFLGGDLVIDAAPHVGFDLQGSVWPMAVSGPSTNESGMLWAVAPAVQGFLFGKGSTPYLSTGLIYAHVSMQTVSASATGTFLNLGYTWKWDSGLGLQLGGGISYLTNATATDGNNMVTIGGKLNPNLELSLRYMFL